MKRGSFLSFRERRELNALIRKHKAEGLKVRRANALILLDKGRSVAFVVDALLLDSENGTPLAPCFRGARHGVVGFGGVSGA